MSFLQHLFGNATEIDPAAVQAEFPAVLVNAEAVATAFRKTGTKQEITSIPWKSIKKFSCVNAGFLNGDGELKIWR